MIHIFMQKGCSMFRFRSMLHAALIGAMLLAQTALAEFTKGPYLQDPTTNTLTVMWESTSPTLGTVSYGTQGQPNLTAQAEEVFDFKPSTTEQDMPKSGEFHLFRAVMKDLQPGTDYAYTVKQDADSAGPFDFHTFPKDNSKVSFIFYGDTRTRPEVHTKIASMMMRHHPEFIWHSGDLVERGANYDLWSPQFFTPLKGVIEHVPLLSAVGNHEDDEKNYLRFLELPSNELYYSFEVGPIHFLSLDFHFEKANDAQFAFAKKDLENTKAPWKIVVLHYPMLNIGGHGTTWGADTYLPMFQKNKVDLVMAGHSHLYERFKPVMDKSSANPWPIVNITSGGGGAPLAKTFDGPGLAVHESVNHYMVIEATADKLTAKAITVDDKPLDTFQLTKTNGQYSPDYIASALDSTEVITQLNIAQSLSPTMQAAPAAEGSAIKFSLTPLKLSAAPVEAEISVAPESAANYELVNGPLKVTLPAKSDKANSIEAQVKALGASAIKGGKVDPPLVFQAKAKVGASEQTITGQPVGTPRPAAKGAKKPASAGAGAGED